MHKKTAICVSLLLLASLPALATPLGQSDCLTVFGPTGAVFAQTCVAEANELAAQFLPVNLPSTGGPSGFIDTSMFGQPTLVLDPDGSISDIFGIVHDNSGI